MKTDEKFKNKETNVVSKQGLSKEFWIAFAVFLLALLVRGVYLSQSSDNPTFYLPIIDSMTYDGLARSLAKGEPMTAEFFWQQFFYPFFLSVVYFLSNSSLLWAKIIQAVLGAGTCLLTYMLGKKIFNRTAGIIAGCMTALYGPLIFFESELLAAGWAAFWSVALILLFLKTAEKKTLLICLALGVCGALSAITRPNFIPFLAGGVVWLIVVWIRADVDIKKLVQRMAVALAGFLIVTIPVTIKNYQLTDRVSFLPATGGLNFYLGNNPEITGVGIRPGLDWNKLSYLSWDEGLRTLDEQQQFYYSKTFEYIRTQPLSFTKGIMQKTAEFFGSREIPGNVDAYMFRQWSSLLKILMWKAGPFGFPFGLLLQLAILGLVFYWRKIPVPLLLFILFYSASVILAHIEARYRMPIVGPMCVLAGAAIVKIVEIIRAKEWPKVGRASILIIVVAAVCSIPGPFYSEKPENINYEAELYYGLGSTLKRRGRLKEAIKNYNQAVRIKPDYAEAYYKLGGIFALQGKIDPAIKQYRKALEIEPEYAEVHYNLGLAFHLQGKTADAMNRYQRAIEIRPDYADAHINLGVLFQSQGKFDMAISHYLEAMKVKPYDADLHNNLAVALQSQGRINEAMAHFERSINLRPDYPPALCGLARILATHPDKKLRNFDKSIVLAERAAKLTGNQSASVLETLSASYAAAGKWDAAIGTAEIALKFALTAENDNLAEYLRKKLEIYQSKKQ